MDKSEIKCTVDELKAAFTEWERRYREDPDKFISEGSKLLNGTPETYGEACGPYFVTILHSVKKKRRIIPA